MTLRFGAAQTQSFGSTFGHALTYAEAIHRMQRRKGTAIPYIGHLLGVASLVIGAGGTEVEAIAALLHDAAEDQGGEPRLRDIEREFGEDVARIVEACSDSLTEDRIEKADWLTRKLAYNAHLRSEMRESVLLVSVCDKAHNVSSMLADYADIGETLWSRFNAGKVGTLLNYRALLAAFEASPAPRVTGVARTLRATLTALEAASGAADDPILGDGNRILDEHYRFDIARRPTASEPPKR